jgi:hypothetical protein
MLGWTANAASTHNVKMLVPLALRIRGSVCMPLAEIFHQVNQFAPVILVKCLHSHCQECNSCASIGSGSFGGIYCLGHQVV